MSPQNESQKGGMLFKILTIVFAIAIAGLIYWSMSTKKELNGMLVEKENLRIELKAELDQLMTQHNQLKADNETISADLTVKDSIIQENAKQIEEGLRYKWSYFNIKKQLTELQDVTKGYEVQIEDLKLENKNLISENTQIKGKFAAEQQKTSELSVIKDQLTEKVEIATELKTYTVNAIGIRAKSSGKEVPTDKTKRTDKIKVCFMLAENALRAAGDIDVFVRIAGPDDVILNNGTGDDFSFNFNGEKLQYSVKQTVSYEKQAVNVCCYWNKNEDQELAAGNYKVEIYEGDTVIGHASFNLR
jgi:hypothetical protein